MAEQYRDIPEIYGDLFRHPMETDRAPRLGLVLAICAMIPLVVTAIFTIRDVVEPARQAVSLLLIAIFTVLFLFFIFRAGRRGMLLALIGQTLTVLFLNVVPGPRDGFLFIIYAILSAQLGMTLRPRVVVVWFLALVAITFGGYLLWYGADGWLSAIGNTTGYFFFVLVGGLMREALLGRERSERLAQELREANEQLQALSLQAQQLAVAEERNRMARELHDSLGHRLTVAVVQLEGAQRLIPSDPERAARVIGAMREQMREALGDLRSAVAALRAPLEDDLPLGPALARLAQSFREGTGLDVILSIHDALPDLSSAQRLAFFRAAQEALTNAQRHSAAQHVWLDVTADPHRIALTAMDDGKGFPDETASGGFGLRGLRERAVLLGGELVLGERESGGAKLVFSLPIHSFEESKADGSRVSPQAGR